LGGSVDHHKFFAEWVDLFNLTPQIGEIACFEFISAIKSNLKI